MGADGCWRMWAQGRGVREHWHGGGPVGGSKGNVNITVRRGKARFPGGCEPHPATVVPAGSGQGGSWRQRHGLKLSGEKGRLGRLSDHAGRNASERRAGLETLNAEADPTVMRGRPPAGREESDERTGRFPPGYWRRHAWKMEGVATREPLSVPCTRQPEPREGQAGPTGWRRGP